MVRELLEGPGRTAKYKGTVHYSTVESSSLIPYFGSSLVQWLGGAVPVVDATVATASIAAVFLMVTFLFRDCSSS